MMMNRHFGTMWLVGLLVFESGALARAQSQAEGETEAVKVARGAYPDVAVDAAGEVHLVYVREGRLWHRQREARSGRWSAEHETGLAQGMVERSDPEVVIDSRGRPHVLVGSSYAWRDGDRWTAVDPRVTRDTALAMDSQDRAYVVRRGGHRGGFLGLLVRQPGAAAFEPLPDPDTANGLPRGRNDHVYGHVFLGPDDAIHVVYRHGQPAHCAYRVSRDGGRTWQGGGLSNDDREAPSGAVGRENQVYVVTGTGEVFRRTGGPGDWTSLGRGLDAGSRDLPVIAVDSEGGLCVASFGGRINRWIGGRWTGQATLPRLAGQPLGFVDLAAADDGAGFYAVWEEGPAVSNDKPAGTSDVLFTVLDRVVSEP